MQATLSPALTPAMHSILIRACLDAEKRLDALCSDVAPYLSPDERATLKEDRNRLYDFANWLTLNSDTEHREVLRGVEWCTLTRALIAVREFGVECRERERILAGACARNARAVVERARMDAERCDQAISAALALHGLHANPGRLAQDLISPL